MEAFKSRSLASTCFVRPVTKFIRAELDEKLNEDDNFEKEFQLLLSSFPTPRSVLDLSLDVKLRKVTIAKKYKQKPNKSA